MFAGGKKKEKKKETSDYALSYLWTFETIKIVNLTRLAYYYFDIPHSSLQMILAGRASILAGSQSEQPHYSANFTIMPNCTGPLN